MLLLLGNSVASFGWDLGSNGCDFIDSEHHDNVSCLVRFYDLQNENNHFPIFNLHIHRKTLKLWREEFLVQTTSRIGDLVSQCVSCAILRTNTTFSPFGGVSRSLKPTSQQALRNHSGYYYHHYYESTFDYWNC